MNDVSKPHEAVVISWLGCTDKIRVLYHRPIALGSDYNCVILSATDQCHSSTPLIKMLTMADTCTRGADPLWPATGDVSGRGTTNSKTSCTICCPHPLCTLSIPSSLSLRLSSGRRRCGTTCLFIHMEHPLSAHPLPCRNSVRQWALLSGRPDMAADPAFSSHRPGSAVDTTARPSCYIWSAGLLVDTLVVYLHIIDVYVIHHGAVSKHDEWDPVSCTRRCAVCTLLESMASRQGSVCGPDQTRAEAANTNMCAHSIVILLDQEEVFQ